MQKDLNNLGNLADYLATLDEVSLLKLKDGAMGKHNYPLARAALEQCLKIMVDPRKKSMMQKNLPKINDLKERLIALKKLMRTIIQENAEAKKNIRGVVTRVRMAFSFFAFPESLRDILQDIILVMGRNNPDQVEVIPNAIYAFATYLVLDALERVVKNIDDDDVLEAINAFPLLPPMGFFSDHMAGFDPELKRLSFSHNPIDLELRIERSAHRVWNNFSRKYPQFLNTHLDMLGQLTHAIYNFLANEWSDGDETKGAELIRVMQDDKHVRYDDLEPPLPDLLAHMDEAAQRLQASFTSVPGIELSPFDPDVDVRRRIKEMKPWLSGILKPFPPLEKPLIKASIRYELAMAPLRPHFESLILSCIDQLCSRYHLEKGSPSEHFYRMAEVVFAYIYGVLDIIDRKPSSDPQEFYVDDTTFFNTAEAVSDSEILSGFNIMVRRPKNVHAAHDRIEKRTKKLLNKHRDFITENKEIFDCFDQEIRKIYIREAVPSPEETQKIFNSRLFPE